MYHDFFGLREAPFRITPNTDFFFAGGNRGAVLDALLYAISQGEGIIKVTGEVGSGKTMLCRMLQARLPQHVLGVYLANPSVSPDEILHAIVHELELELRPAASRLEAMQKLTAFLLECHAAGRQVVLFVEESQSMPIATLEEIRLLSNLETERHKLLQIVLFGQPELDALLRRPEIRQLRERITHGFDLAPLSLVDIGLYLNFRMRAAGYKGPDLFGPRVVSQIARASAGLTRRVNLLGDKILLAAFADNTHALAPPHVRAAILDSEFAQSTGKAPGARYWPIIAGTLGVALLLAVGWSIWLYGRTVPVGNTATDGMAARGTLATAPPAGPSAVTGGATAAAQPGSPLAGAPASAAADLAAGGLPGKGQGAAAASSDTLPPVAAPTPASVSPPSAPASPQTGAAAVAPVAAAAPDRDKAAASDESLLRARLVATRSWLVSAPPETFSIQLLGSRSETQLDQQLRSLAKQIDPEQLFVFRTQAGGRPSMTVLYGTYPSREAARSALAALPARIRNFRPHLRTVDGVKSEIAASIDVSGT